jgi:hypothetical protein
MSYMFEAALVLQGLVVGAALAAVVMPSSAQHEADAARTEAEAKEHMLAADSGREEQFNGHILQVAHSEEQFDASQPGREPVGGWRPVSEGIAWPHDGEDPLEHARRLVG